MSYYKPTDQGDQQVRLRFSRYANEVIQYDMFLFNEVKANTFINTVIRNYYESAATSINMRLNDYRSLLEEQLISKGSNTTIRQLIDVLVKHEEERLIDISKSYDAPDKYSKSKPYRLQNDLYEEFAGEASDFNEDKYYPRSCSLYIRTLIEEYTRLPYILRERIYFKTYFEIIESAIEHRQQLLITTASGRKFYTLPYKILSDPLSTVNYLTGYSYLPAEEAKSKYTVSYKVSSIKNIKIVKSRSGYLHPCDVSRLNSEISEKGVQFLVSEYTQICVRFTDNGMKLFNQLLHLRPEPVSITKEKDSYIAVFNCSMKQAETYFFKFGANVRILSPDTLRDKFLHNYQQAVSSYLNN